MQPPRSRTLTRRRTFLLLALLAAAEPSRAGSFPKPDFIGTCRTKLEQMFRNVEADNFLRDAREAEVMIEKNSFERARNYAQSFPALERLKFEVPSMGAPNVPFGATDAMWGWSPVRSRLPQSAFFGEMVGWQFKDLQGRIFSYRLDWDPVKKAHINVLITAPEIAGGVRHTWKAAITFKCGGLPCTADDVKKLVRSNFGAKSL